MVEEGAVPRTTAQGEKLKILIVEDEPMSQFLLQSSLEVIGYYEIEIVANATDAIEYLKNNRDVFAVFLDNQLGKDKKGNPTSGQDVVKFIVEERQKQGKDNNLMPFITMSAGKWSGDNNVDENRFDEMGKPLNFVKLQEIMGKLHNNLKKEATPSPTVPAQNKKGPDGNKIAEELKRDRFTGFDL